MKILKTKNNGAFARTGLVLALAAIGITSATAQEAVDTDKLFKEGVFLREQGKVFSSIEALETVISSNPTLHRARLELAVAYYRSLNYDKAKAEGQRVLDDPKTPENVRLAVLAFMAQIERDRVALVANRHTWEPSVSAGVLYDTNVNVGPSSGLLPGGLILTPGSLPREDWAGVVQAGITHTYNSPNVVRLGESAARFIWQSHAGVYHKGYFKEDNYNLTVATLSTGPGLIAPERWRANLNLQVDDLYLGGDHLAVYTSLTPSITWTLNNGELTWDAIFLKKDFVRGQDTGRDADYWATGVSYGHLFNQGKVALQGGVHTFGETANASRFSNDGWEIFLGANVVAWQNGNIYGRYNHKEAAYNGVEFTGQTRNDTEDRYELGFGHDFKEGALNKWRLSGSWQRTENRSNVSLYTFRREVTGVNLSRSF